MAKRPRMVILSISRAVREVIDQEPSIQDSLQRGYGNLSAIARLIKGRVEEVIKGKASLEATITAIKRARSGYKVAWKDVRSVISRSVVNVRTDVAKLSAERSRKTQELVRRILANFQEEFLQVSESISAITLVFDQKLHPEIRKAFKDEDILEDEPNLAAIIVRSPQEIIKTSGCAIAFYNQVSRRGINIEDTVSCYTDTIIIVRIEDVGRAFLALSELIASARRPRPSEV